MSDINAIFKQLESLSLFELSRLRTAISIVLEDPLRHEAIKQHLKIGMKITYFSSERNDLVEATIVDIRNSRASVINTEDGVKWNIKLYVINLQGIDTRITPKKPSAGLDRNSLKIGDCVGWNTTMGQEVYGVIEKLNPKRAVISLSNGEEWTVSYPLLFPVIDGASAQRGFACIEGEVIK